VEKGTSRDSHSSWERQERPSRKVGKVRVEETQRVYWLSGGGNGACGLHPEYTNTTLQTDGFFFLIIPIN
jgi:hypothetical protein